jgi:hypothetical protein
MDALIDAASKKVNVLASSNLDLMHCRIVEALGPLSALKRLSDRDYVGLLHAITSSLAEKRKAR